MSLRTRSVLSFIVLATLTIFAFQNCGSGKSSIGGAASTNIEGGDNEVQAKPFDKWGVSAFSNGILIKSENGSVYFLGRIAIDASNYKDYTSPLVITGAPKVKRLGSACAVTQDQRVICYRVKSTTQIEYVYIDGLTDVVDIASDANSLGTGSLCALKVNGTVWCVGRGLSGRLGNGTTNDSSVPVQALGITNAKQISGNTYSICALIDNGTVKCWGTNDHGQAGAGFKSAAGGVSIPTTVVGLSDVRDIGGGGVANCAVLKSGQIKCWGGSVLNSFADDNNYSTNPAELFPKTIAGIDDAVTISASSMLSYCTLRKSGKLSCWGWNGYGQTNPNVVSNGSKVVEIAGLPAIASVHSIYSNTCIVSTAGDLYCWGQNFSTSLFGMNTATVPPTLIGSVN